jgi:hypothetical protein
MYSSNNPRETDEDCARVFLNKPGNKKEFVVEMRKDAAAASGYVDGPRVGHNEPKKTKHVTFNV